MPAGYIRVWVPWDEALEHVQRSADCMREDAERGLIDALQDGAVASQFPDGTAIDPAQWYRVVLIIGVGPLLDDLHSAVEVRREDLERIWPPNNLSGNANEGTEATMPASQAGASTNSAPTPERGGLSQFVKGHIADERAAKRGPTKNRLEAAWRNAGRKGDRQRLRAEFDREMGDAAPRRGRPKKSPN